MEEESTFLKYVRHTFKRWTGLQEAINDGMGGPYAKEKESWIGTEVENYFKTYNDVVPDDIEDYLGEMLENEFSAYFEDGSLQEVSKNFCIAYSLSLTDPTNTIFQEMQQKAIYTQRPTRPVMLSSPPTPLKPEEVTGEEMDTNDDEADGWTIVSKKKTKDLLKT